MANALKLVRDELKPVMICPGHGPVLDSDLDDLYEKYAEWCGEVTENQPKKVVIPYVSAYGYTAQLAEKIAEGLKASGDFDVSLHDMVTDSKGKSSR